MRFQYIIEKCFYTSLPVPYIPQMREHIFTIRAQYLPYHVPHGANPRHQNISKSTYVTIQESFKDKSDMTFHIKNHGIVVIASNVEVHHLGTDWLSLMVDIPDDLGNADGQHSYDIVSSLRAENPNQMIKIYIKENMPEELINVVAETLNTSVQVTASTIANKRLWFDPIKEAIKGKPYAEWVGYSQNQPNVSAPIKNILSILWVANPLLYQRSEKHPGWIYTRANQVFDKGFYENETTRNQMLKAAHLLPDLIDLYIYVNETTHLLAPKRSRISTSKHKDLTEQPKRESNIKSLCVDEPLHFRQPTTRGPHLREQYVFMVLSGFKNMIKIDPKTDKLEWRGSREDIFNVINRCHKKLMKCIINQFKHDGSDHGKTRSQPSLWNLIELEVGKEIESYFTEKKQQQPALASVAYLPLPRN